eukprot:6010711-Prymnesium_polylepis.1
MPPGRRSALKLQVTKGRPRGSLIRHHALIKVPRVAVLLERIERSRSCRCQSSRTARAKPSTCEILMFRTRLARKFRRFKSLRQSIAWMATASTRAVGH